MYGLQTWGDTGSLRVEGETKTVDKRTKNVRNVTQVIQITTDEQV